jgi:uncharacterized protein YbjT (DUF2867 family)
MILVTEATGAQRIGAIRQFVRNGQPVRALVRSAAKPASLGAPPGVELVEGDMRRDETLGEARDGV